MIKVLHLSAHLGGGVGKALSGLVKQAKFTKSDVQHLFVCLEKPEKRQFVDRVRETGCQVIIHPEINVLRKLINDSDVIQLEWWNHPATIKYLCSLTHSPMRLITWCHVSGLHTPIIPPRLILSAHRFLFTSFCSFQSNEVLNLPLDFMNHLDVVSSSGGFSGLPEECSRGDGRIRVGYLGSLNFAKLHPDYVNYLEAVQTPGFKVRMIGDLSNQEVLIQQCNSIGKVGMFEFRGYSKDIASELASINVLAYILNPEHYGTTENSLLEAMAMGIVPIVLDNPAEKQIVEDHVTGLIVHSPQEFAEAIDWLANNPSERNKIGSQAAKSVRNRFSVNKVESSLKSNYQEVLLMEKREISFLDIFGNNPAEWFLSCQENKSIFSKDGNIIKEADVPLSHILFEKRKGSVFHFSKYFPESLELKLWAKNLKLYQ